MAFMPAIRACLAALALAAVAITAPAAAQVPLSEITDTRPTLAPGDRVLGEASAPLTIFEYASLSCPHCAAFHAEALPRLRSDWLAPGKAKLVFRDFPLDAPGLRAAAVARCAPAERYFEIVDALFSHQKEWAQSKTPADEEASVARITGLGVDQVHACAADATHLDAIVADRLKAATKYGVTATPTFFIGGRTMVGDRPYRDFDAALREAAQR